MKTTDTFARLKRDVALTTYCGPEWLPELSTQRDHVEFATVVIAYDRLTDPALTIFDRAGAYAYPNVDGFIDSPSNRLPHKEISLRIGAPYAGRGGGAKC